MYRSLAVLALTAGSFAAAGANGATAGNPHHRGGHRHVASTSAHPPGHINYPMGDMLSAAYAPRPGSEYALRTYGEARPKLAMERALGGGAMGSVGLEHGSAPADLHDLNGVMMSVPQSPSTLVGAQVSYTF